MTRAREACVYVVLCWQLRLGGLTMRCAEVHVGAALLGLGLLFGCGVWIVMGTVRVDLWWPPDGAGRETVCAGLWGRWLPRAGSWARWWGHAGLGVTRQGSLGRTAWSRGWDDIARLCRWVSASVSGGVDTGWRAVIRTAKRQCRRRRNYVSTSGESVDTVSGGADGSRRNYGPGENSVAIRVGGGARGRSADDELRVELYSATWESMCR